MADAEQVRTMDGVYFRHAVRRSVIDAHAALALAVRRYLTACMVAVRHPADEVARAEIGVTHGAMVKALEAVEELSR